MSNEHRDWQADEIQELRARLLEAEALITARPYQFDTVWEKYRELESIDPDNASGISKIGASFLYTAGFSEGRHHANTEDKTADENEFCGVCGGKVVVAALLPESGE